MVPARARSQRGNRANHKLGVSQRESGVTRVIETKFLIRLAEDGEIRKETVKITAWDRTIRTVERVATEWNNKEGFDGVWTWNGQPSAVISLQSRLERIEIGQGSIEAPGYGQTMDVDLTLHTEICKNHGSSIFA
jgi:hypothetical protein